MKDWIGVILMLWPIVAGLGFAFWYDWKMGLGFLAVLSIFIGAGILRDDYE